MEWLAGAVLVVAGWFFFVRNAGDTNLKRVRATNWMLERYAVSIQNLDTEEFARATALTVALKIGINALKTKNVMLVDENVLSIFKQLSENDSVIFSLLKHSPEKITEFKYAFHECHERLLAMTSQRNKSAAKGGW